MNAGFAASYFAIWVLVLFLAAVSIGLLQEVRRLKKLPLGRLPYGSPLPRFSGNEVGSGRRFHSRELMGRPGIILLLSSTCPSCAALVGEIKREGATQRILAAVCVDSGSQCREFKSALPGIPVISNTDVSVGDLLGIKGVPLAIAIDSSFMVRAYEHAESYASLETLSRSIVGARSLDTRGAPRRSATA